MASVSATLWERRILSEAGRAFIGNYIADFPLDGVTRLVVPAVPAIRIGGRHSPDLSPHLFSWGELCRMPRLCERRPAWRSAGSTIGRRFIWRRGTRGPSPDAAAGPGR